MVLGLFTKRNFNERKGGIRIRKSRIVLLALALLAAGALIWLLVQRQEEQRLAASSVPQQEIVYTGEEFLMDTFITQRVYGEDGENTVLAVNQLLQDMERVFSNYLPDSEIGKVNAGAGIAAVEVSEETFGVIRRSLELSAASGGIFDITIAPLVKLWGITSENPKVPSADEISNALSYIGYDQVDLDEAAHTVFMPRPGISMDLGAVVKGYAAEKCRDVYEEANVTGALISLGGTVVTVGTHSDGKPFQIGLRDPNGGSNDIFGVLSGEERIIATSGGYERYFEQDGKRYEHILDPRTGYPVETDLLSVTAVSGDGLLADYLSTTLYMLGSEVLEENLNRAEFSVVAVKTDGTILISDDLKERFTLKEESGYTFAS